MSSGLFARRNVAIFLGALLVLGVVLIAVIQGLGKDDVPSGDVAVVDGNAITQADFDTAFQQAASQAGLPQPPAPGDDQYEQVRDQALSTLLDSAWIEGEGERQGVEVTDKEVQDTFTQLKDQNFQTEEEYQQFLQQSGLTQEDIDERVRLQVISQKIQEQITNDTPEVSDEEAREFYDANKAQFEQPESRDIRVIVNNDPAQVEQALTQLQADNSPENWKRVAAAVLNRSPVKGQGRRARRGRPGDLRGAAQHRDLRGARGRGQGPVETSVSNYAFQVDIDHPRQHHLIRGSPAEQIKQQLEQQAQQGQFAAFLADYRDHWVELTICSDDFLTERCDNFKGNPAPCPDPSLTPEQQQQQLQQSGCPPPVLTISPAPPGDDHRLPAGDRRPCPRSPIRPVRTSRRRRPSRAGPRVPFPGPAGRPSRSGSRRRPKSAAGRGPQHRRLPRAAR